MKLSTSIEITPEEMAKLTTKDRQSEKQKVEPLQNTDWIVNLANTIGESIRKMRSEGQKEDENAHN